MSLKKIVCFLSLLLLVYFICYSSIIIPIANHTLISFKYTKKDMYRVFTKQQFYIKGSSFPIKLVLFDALSENQNKLCEFLKISPTLFEQQLQKSDNDGPVATRVSDSSEMVFHVSKYVGALGYLPTEDKVIFNNGEIVYLEVE